MALYCEVSCIFRIQKCLIHFTSIIKVLNKNGKTWNLSTQRITDLDKEEKKDIVDLLIHNMKTQYEKSSWGWNEKSKKDEMMEKAAWYLLLKNEEGKIYGFSHFRYDMDCNEEVLYVYEVCSLV